MEERKDADDEGVNYAVEESNDNDNDNDGDIVIRIRGKGKGNDAARKWSRENIHIKEIVSERWLKARIQILRLLDEDTSRDEKTRIVDDLMCLVEAMSKGVTLKVEPGDGENANSDAIVWTLSEYGASASSKVDEQQPAGLRPRPQPQPQPLAEVNHRLFSLSDAISSVKNKMLLGRRDLQRDRVNSVVDVHVCRHIHRNFRRILQKESRFLRDELFSARERIYRLERKYVMAAGGCGSGSGSGSGSRNANSPSNANNEKGVVVEQSAFYNTAPSARLIPYYDLCAYQPVSFINIMEPATAATAIVPAQAHQWNPTIYGAPAPADRLYSYHCDLFRPLPVGYESLAAVANYNNAPPQPQPPPPPPLPPLPPLPPPSLPPLLYESAVYDQQSRCNQRSVEQCDRDAIACTAGSICVPSLKFGVDAFSSDESFHNKDEK